MIAALWAATILSLTVAAASLALGLLLSRRYRELHRAVSQQSAAPVKFELPAAGTPVPDFAVVTTTTGTPVTATDFAGTDTPVAILLVGCEPCAQELPALRQAFARADGPTRPLAVIVGSGEDKQKYLSELGPVARIVEDEAGNGLAAALGVRSFPAVLVLGAGEIRRAAATVAAAGLIPAVSV